MQHKQKIVCITGCLGFIGSYVTRLALEKGWYVYGIDKITSVSNVGDPLNEFTKNYANFKFVKEDIVNLKDIIDCDYIINLAAESHVENSIVSSNAFMHSNVLGVENLLNIIKNKSADSIRKPVFLHVSTDEVYGDIQDGSHAENHILKPSNPYSASKAAADMLVLAWSRTFGVDYVLLRPTNNYGIGQYPEKLIPLTVKNLNRGRKVRLHNEGTPIRTWLHASDTAKAIIHIVESNIKNEIFNVSSNYEQSNLLTVNKIISCYFGVDEDINKYVDFEFSRQGQDVRYSLDDSKLRSTGWQDQRFFDDEIESIVSFYKNNFIW